MIRAILLLLAAAVVTTLPSASEAKKTEAPTPGAERISKEKVLAQRLRKNISLDDLLAVSGYSISDEKVVAFLTEFLDLNPSVKSISSLKKGSLVRIPLTHVTRTSHPLPVIKDKQVTSAVRRAGARKKERTRQKQESPRADRAVILRNVQDLFAQLGERVTIEQEGFKVFQISEKSDLSFDTSLFPVIDLHNEHVLVIDYADRFSEEMRDLLEVTWPEYRVVSVQGRGDLRALVPALLHESGYAFYENGKMISGGASQVEYHADYLVYGKNGVMMENDVSLISILGKNEYQTPGELVSWFAGRDVRIIELSEQQKRQMNRMRSEFIAMDVRLQGREFAEKILDVLGYPYASNAELSLSNMKGFRYTRRADISVDLGYRKKVIDFSEISEQERESARSFGLDIVGIHPFAERNDVLKKMLSLLLLNRSETAKTNALYLTPKGTRYRLMLPGFVVQAVKGQFFITDTDLDVDVLGNIVTEDTTVIQF